MNDFMTDGPETAPATIILGHGAGAPMDSPFMTAIAQRLSNQGLRVVRFEFAYMAERRTSGSRRPPPAAEKLVDPFRDVVSKVAQQWPGPVFIGGKSMGGRVASLAADDLVAAGTVSGLICLGFPFHPPGKPEKLRTAHLEQLTAPALICQGERDPFGSRPEVEGYKLSEIIEFCWLPDGNHDLVPRKASGHTADGNWDATAVAIVEFARKNDTKGSKNR